MRRGVMVGGVALGLMVARSAVAQDVPHCHGYCQWDLIIRFPANESQDLYAAGDSREECERLVEQIRAAHSEPAPNEMECVDRSQLDSRLRDHFPDARPAE